jgi:hypothetical protein
MARVVREDWPHVDMDMGKRQVGEGKWAGEEGARAHTLQGLIRRASRLSPVPRVSGLRRECRCRRGMYYIYNVA